MTIETIFTPRIQACLEAGSADALVPLLATWQRPELERLHSEIHLSFALAIGLLDDTWRTGRKTCPPDKRAEMKRDYLQYREDLTELFAEIHDAVLFYLRDETPEVLQ